MSEAEEGAVGNQESGREENDEEMRAEDESAKAMEAEVPHPEGYADEAQEPPA